MSFGKIAIASGVVSIAAVGGWWTTTAPARLPDLSTALIVQPLDVPTAAEAAASDPFDRVAPAAAGDPAGAGMSLLRQAFATAAGKEAPLPASAEPTSDALPTPLPAVDEETVQTAASLAEPARPRRHLHRFAEAGRAARPAQPAHAAPSLLAARPARAAPGYYVEQVVEEGDSGGEVKYKYVRRRCGPANMVDVCYMPAESRRNIVVQRW